MPERNLDFDTAVNRKNTSSLKYDFAVERRMPADVLPLWVADMDFKTSSYIEDALAARSHHAVFGYSEAKDDYFDAVSGWMERRHGWSVKKEWLIKTPGVVFALAMAVKAYTDPGEAVLIQSPVYYPFSEVIEDNGRKVVSNDLVFGEDNRYRIDFDDFEKKIINNNIKLFLLCSPHNPSGRVWTKPELERMGKICLRYGVIVVSDEIHEDFVFKGKHHVFAGIKEDFAGISVIATSPSKTFNLAGLMISNIFIPDEDLRRKFKKQVDAAGISQLGTMGLEGVKTAYTYGDEWYEAMLSYVKDNIDFTRDFVREKLPGVNMADIEGTYLVWLDFNGTGLCGHEINDLIINKAGLWLDSGEIFGKSGTGFQRINAACPRSTLMEALERIEKALSEREYYSTPGF